MERMVETLEVAGSCGLSVTGTRNCQKRETWPWSTNIYENGRSANLECQSTKGRIAIILQVQNGARVNMYIYLTWAWRVSRTCSLSRWLVGGCNFKIEKIRDAYLKLNLGLSNVLLAATAVGDLLGLSNLVADSLKVEHHVLVSHALSQKKK